MKIMTNSVKQKNNIEVGKALRKGQSEWKKHVYIMNWNTIIMILLYKIRDSCFPNKWSKDWILTRDIETMDSESRKTRTVFNKYIKDFIDPSIWIVRNLI